MNNPQIIKTAQGEELVVLPMAEYKELIEGISDVSAYDTAKESLSAGDDELIPAEFSERLMDGECPVRVWREYRGIKSKELAAAAGISPAYLSQIESGVRIGQGSTREVIANALNVTVDDLS